VNQNWNEEADGGVVTTASLPPSAKASDSKILKEHCVLIISVYNIARLIGRVADWSRKA
jgi:hypothetical protein